MPATFYVDPEHGSDHYRGASWSDPLATIQRAFDVAGHGDEVVLASCPHDVGDGAACEDEQKALTVRGARPLMARQHSHRSHPQTSIYSSAKVKPSALIRVGHAGSPHVYGWTFAHLYFDADTIAPGGAFLETHGANRAHLEDIAGRGLDPHQGRYVLRAGPGSGNDASWWRFRDIYTQGVGFAHSRAGNYWEFHGVTIGGGGHGPRATYPAFDVMGSQHNFAGLAFEGWDTAILATGCRGLMGHGIMSESVKTLVHMVGCRDSIIAVNSAAGIGHSDVVDENGTNNTVIGAHHRKVGTTTRAHTVSTYGTTPTQLAAGSASPIYGRHPNNPEPGVELLPGAMDLIGSTTIRAEYHDGTGWKPWGVQPGVLSVSNHQSITVDAEHARCRFRTGSLQGYAQGLAYARTIQHNGKASTVTFRTIGADGSTVMTELTATLDSPAQMRGAMASLPDPHNAFYYEVEFNFGITEWRTAQIRRLALYATEVEDNIRGKQSRGAAAPEGVIHGAPGDTYQCTVDDIGLWVHAGPSGATGWRKLAYA